MDVALLKYRMERKGLQQHDLCSKIGISRTAFYRKCNGQSDFTIDEIKRIADTLELKFPTDIVNIFFGK